MTDRKPIFDFIRRMLERPFRQSEVDAIDCVLDGEKDCFQDTVTPVTPPFPIGAEGIALIKGFEGCARVRDDGLIEAYPDPGTGGDPWTIGWGATGADRFHGGRIARGTVWTQAQCDARLEEDLARYAKEVAQALGDAPTTQAQFDALVSFHYNTGAIGKATLTRKHRAGDYAGAAREFDRWCYAGGRVLKGLARRRAAEAQLYRDG
ncbi:lysozyme [Aurantiacibacter sp. MUD61]|uniref:lysozyme n=1 Tax=Aurantiacibacter sp. MUD61 TaxID=3009083 RepID=UPI0022F005C5|nr:lysozyme [Aurantiacibacter sp. MUD61]